MNNNEMPDDVERAECFPTPERPPREAQYGASEIERPRFSAAELQVVLNENRNLKMRLSALEKALKSIAANTCCDSCQEASLVAKKALGINQGEKK